MGLLCCAETLVRNFQCSLHNNPKDSSFHLLVFVFHKMWELSLTLGQPNGFRRLLLHGFIYLFIQLLS